MYTQILTISTANEFLWENQGGSMYTSSFGGFAFCDVFPLRIFINTEKHRMKNILLCVCVFFQNIKNLFVGLCAMYSDSYVGIWLDSGINRSQRSRVGSNTFSMQMYIPVKLLKAVCEQLNFVLVNVNVSLI
jgi:hypothetical protein